MGQLSENDMLGSVKHGFPMINISLVQVGRLFVSHMVRFDYRDR